MLAQSWAPSMDMMLVRQCGGTLSCASIAPGGLVQKLMSDIMRLLSLTTTTTWVPPRKSRDGLLRTPRVLHIEVRVASFAPASSSNETGGDNALGVFMYRPMVEGHVLGLRLRDHLPTEDAAIASGSGGNDVARVLVAVAIIATRHLPSSKISEARLVAGARQVFQDRWSGLHRIAMLFLALLCGKHRNGAIAQPCMGAAWLNLMLKAAVLNFALGSCRKVTHLLYLQHTGSMFCACLLFGNSTLSVGPLEIARHADPLFASSSGMGASASDSPGVGVPDFRRGDPDIVGRIFPGGDTSIVSLCAVENDSFFPAEAL